MAAWLSPSRAGDTSVGSSGLSQQQDSQFICSMPILYFLFNKMIFMCSYKTSLSHLKDIFLSYEQFLITQVIALTELFLPLSL